jgi:hypothetical protein
MQHLRTSPWSGQAAVKPASIAIASYLPLRGSVRRIEKRERETPVDKLGVDGVGGDRCPTPNKVVQRWV